LGLKMNRLTREIAFLFRPNRYSFVGAALGMISVFFLTWIRVPESTRVFIGRQSFSSGALDLLQWTLPFRYNWSYADMVIHGASAWHLPLLVFLLGTVIALVTPVGGFFQIGGLAAFTLMFVFPYSFGYRWYLDVGFYVALISTAIVIQTWRMQADYALGNRTVRNTSRVAAILPRTVGLQR
jgi:hypothetical protein